MKILITGANGLLGHELSSILKDHTLILLSHSQLDISDSESVNKQIDSSSPDIIINSAAYTQVDACETNYDLAFKSNSIGPKNLAIKCKQLEIPLIHISTDYVFEGNEKKNSPLIENDKLGPKTVYGKTKLEGEKLVQENCEKYFILRTAWLYGEGKNFVKTMLSLSKKNKELKVVNDQIGSPTYAKDLAKAIKEIIEKKSDKYGIYHVTNKGEVSWYEFAKKIFEIKNIEIKVNPCTSEEFPRPAPRPHYSVLSNQKWIDAGFTPMRDYEEALNEYLDSLKDE
jgi:dTDP-4-dehydrorhamnose reductase